MKQSFLAVILSFFVISMFAEEQFSAPAVPPKKEEKKEEEKKSESESQKSKSDYDKLYEEYIQKYKKSAEQPSVPQANSETAVQPSESAAPLKEEASIQLPEIPKNNEHQTELVENKQIADEPKLPQTESEVKPLNSNNEKIETEKASDYEFKFKAFTGSSMTYYMFGDDRLDDSFKFKIDNAVLDFNFKKSTNTRARILADLIDPEVSSKNIVVPNYNSEAKSPSTIETADFADILREASIEFDALGSYASFKIGRFRIPFGIENELHDYEIPYFYRSIASDYYLGGGFKDNGISLRSEIPFLNQKIAAAVTVFNGSNKEHLDGNQYYSSPAFGFDLRYFYESDLSITGSFSFINGPSYHEFNSDAAGGIAQKMSENSKNPDWEGFEPENLYKRSTDKRTSIAAFSLSADYKIKEDLKAGLKAEFFAARRMIYNAFMTLQSGEEAYLLQDYASTYRENVYQSSAFYIELNCEKADLFSAAVRYSASKQPFVYNYLKDMDNKLSGIDVLSNFYLNDAFSVGLNFRRMTEELWKVDYLNAKNVKETFYHTMFTANVGFNFEKIFYLNN